MDEAREREIERRREDAKTQHDRYSALASENFTLVGTFSNAAMRAPALAAAGGIAGLLGFFSANRQALLNTAGVPHFNASLMWFCITALLCVLVPAIAYLSQGCFTYWAGSHTYHWDQPYVRSTASTRRWRNAGLAFQATAILVVVCSFLSLMKGGWHFMELASFLADAQPHWYDRFKFALPRL